MTAVPHLGKVKVATHKAVGPATSRACDAVATVAAEDAVVSVTFDHRANVLGVWTNDSLDHLCHHADLGGLEWGEINGK